MVFFISQHLLLRTVWSDVPFIWFTTARAAAHPRFTAFWLQMCRLALAAHRSRWYKSKLPPMHIMNVLCIWSDTSDYKHMTMCQLTDDDAQHSFNASKVRPSAFLCLAACLNTCNHHLTLHFDCIKFYVDTKILLMGVQHFSFTLTGDWYSYVF